MKGVMKDSPNLSSECLSLPRMMKMNCLDSLVRVFCYVTTRFYSPLISRPLPGAYFEMPLRASNSKGSFSGMEKLYKNMDKK